MGDPGAVARCSAAAVMTTVQGGQRHEPTWAAPARPPGLPGPPAGDGRARQGSQRGPKQMSTPQSKDIGWTRQPRAGNTARSRRVDAHLQSPALGNPWLPRTGPRTK